MLKDQEEAAQLREKNFQFSVSLKDGHFAINFFQRLPTKLMYCTQTQKKGRGVKIDRLVICFDRASELHP